MVPYFHKTDVDEAFYDHNIRSRIPSRIIDAHGHFSLPEHDVALTEKSHAVKWVLDSWTDMSYEDARGYASALFPKLSVDFVALPKPLRGVDTAGNNSYIAALIRDKGIRGLYTPLPEEDTAQIERKYISGGFCGFKPYPYMADAVIMGEVSIFEFMPKEQFALADKLKAAVLLHLPRAGRLADGNNISEIREILDRYPDIKLVLAHFGRCFQPMYFEKGLDLLGDDIKRLWFDTSAVISPDVYELAAGHLDRTRIIFGTDIPIMLWHGRYEWDDKGYYNICREDFVWNKHKYPDEEAGYTYYVYEQINNTLNAFEEDKDAVENIFHRNAENVYKGV